MSRGAQQERLRELVLMRRVRDRIDRDYAQPLDVPGVPAAHDWKVATAA